MAYMNVDEIEAALDALAAEHPQVTELIALPNLTPENRPLPRASDRPGRGTERRLVLAIGGLHAREWMPPDALVNLAADLLEGMPPAPASATAAELLARQDKA